MVATNPLRGLARPPQCGGKAARPAATREALPIPVGTPLVLHTTAFRGALPKGVTADTTMQNHQGEWVYCVYCGMTSHKNAQVMLQGGTKRAVPAAAITPERVADAETVERCGQFVRFVPPSVGEEGATKTGSKRSRQGLTPAVIDRPDDEGPVLVVKVPTYDLGAVCDTAGMRADLDDRHGAGGKTVVAFCEPPSSAGTVELRFQDRRATVAYAGFADRFVVTDPDEAKDLFNRFYHQLRPVAAPQEPEREETRPPIAPWPTAMERAGSMVPPPARAAPTTTPSPFRFAAPATAPAVVRRVAWMHPGAGDPGGAAAAGLHRSTTALPMQTPARLAPAPLSRASTAPSPSSSGGGPAQAASLPRAGGHTDAELSEVRADVAAIC